MLPLKRRQHNLFHRGREILLDNRHLRQQSNFTALEAFAKLDASRFRREQAGNTSEERRLAGTVPADDAEIVTHVDIVIQVTDNILVAVPESQLATCYQGNQFVHIAYFKPFFSVSRFDFIMDM